MKMEKAYFKAIGEIVAKKVMPKVFGAGGKTAGRVIGVGAIA